MHDQNTRVGTQLIRLGLWSLVLVATAFFVPRAGLSMLNEITHTGAMAIVKGLPVIIMLSMLPCAIAFELWSFRRIKSVQVARKLIPVVAVPCVVIVAWAIVEPYLYIGLMHPHGYARHETALLISFGLAFTGTSFYWFRRFATRLTLQPSASHRYR